tara:strand:+ start:178 stop:882 length:705 start_codon:yes stop_codon:yes gene_type:complete
MNNAPVTMSIITEGAGTHFLMFLQHMMLSGDEPEVHQTPVHSEKNDLTSFNRWDTWTHGLSFQTPRDTKRNIRLGGTSWNDKNNTETTEERLAYFDSVIEEHGGIHFGVIHSYPTWLEEHFNNIGILFHLDLTEETSKRCYNLFEIKNGHVPEYDSAQWLNNKTAVQKNQPLCAVGYDDLYTFCYRESVRKFINFTLSTRVNPYRVTDNQLDTLQYWIDLYTTKNDNLLANNNK